MKYSKLAGAISSILTMVSPVLNTKVLYYYKYRKPIDLKHPKTFAEKLLYLKLFDYQSNPLVRKCADKYKVREFIREKGMEALLNELIAVYDAPESIEWDKLPQKFVIKLNHAAGYNIVCADEAKMDKSSVVKTISKWLTEKPWLAHAEYQYYKVEPKILVEKFLEGKNGGVPEDYKIYCFNGEAKAVLYMEGRFSNQMTDGFFDPKSWQYLGAANSHTKAFEASKLPEAPESLHVMVHAAEELSKGFPFVRVDFYDVDGSAIFGEMTFTPSGGFDASEIAINGKSMGDFIQL